MAGINFTANPNDAQEGFPLIPAGDYVAAITSSEVKVAKSGNGASYLNLEWTILDGPQKGSKCFEILNLWNPNQQAVEISKRSMNAICKALNMTGVKDSTELHNKPMVVKIGVSKDNNGNDQNKIKSHSEYTGASLQVAGSSSSASPKMPWQQ